MATWLDLSANTISPTPQDWEAVDPLYDPGPPEIPARPHYALVSDSDDASYTACTFPDRSQLDVLGLPAGSYLSPLETLTDVRIYGRFATVAVLGVPDPTIYARIYHRLTLEEYGELSVVQAQTFTPVVFDMGTLSGLSIAADQLPFVGAEFSVLSAGATEHQVILWMSKVQFDYTGTVAQVTSKPVGSRGTHPDAMAHGTSSDVAALGTSRDANAMAHGTSAEVGATGTAGNVNARAR